MARRRKPLRSSTEKPIYLMAGHGLELPDDPSLIVPRGRTLVVTTMLGMVTYSDIPCRLMELFSRPRVRNILLNMNKISNREWLSRELQLLPGHEVHVFLERALIRQICTFFRAWHSTSPDCMPFQSQKCGRMCHMIQLVMPAGRLGIIKKETRKNLKTRLASSWNGFSIPCIPL